MNALHSIAIYSTRNLDQPSAKEKILTQDVYLNKNKVNV